MSQEDILTNARYISLLEPLTITTAVSATATTPVTGLAGMKYLIVMAKFVGGTAGTSVKAYVQTSFDKGVTWIDVICFAFANTAVVKINAINYGIAVAANITPTDGTLTDNTILNGVFGDQIRLKYVTVGTYSGGTSLEVDALAKG